MIDIIFWMVVGAGLWVGIKRIRDVVKKYDIYAFWDDDKKNNP